MGCGNKTAYIHTFKEITNYAGCTLTSLPSRDLLAYDFPAHVLNLRWAWHVAPMGEGRGVYRVLVGKPEGKRPLGRPRHRWEDNIKMDIQEVGCVGMDWIELAQDRDRRRALVNAVMNLWFP